MHRRISTTRAGMLRTIASIATLALLAGVGSAVAQDLPRTGAERADWTRHTSHEELVEFLFEVQSRTDNMLIRELTKTDEGRTMFLVILGDPPAATPGSAWLSGKPTVLLGQNVHGGELSGREGGLQLMVERHKPEQDALIPKGSSVFIRIPSESILLFDPDTGRRI